MHTSAPNYATSTLVATAVSLILVGCGGMPRQDAQLDTAHSAVRVAHNDPRVTGEALDELARADAALVAADAALHDGKPLADVDHQAHLADRYAHAAQAHGQLLVSTAAVATLATRRNAVLLGAREADAARSANIADRKTLEASNARVEAAASDREMVAATQRADVLDAQLTALQAKQTDRGVVVTLGDVLFATGKSDLRQGSQRSIGSLVAFLNAHPDRTVRVEGYTDSVGGDDYNLALSNRRADAVTDALTHGGIVQSRIQTAGYGNSRPIAGNDTSDGRQQNRRVEVVISDAPVVTGRN